MRRRRDGAERGGGEVVLAGDDADRGESRLGDVCRRAELAAGFLERADLLGDDEKTVREHYARWVPERQERLTRILKDAFGERPKPS